MEKEQATSKERIYDDWGDVDLSLFENHKIVEVPMEMKKLVSLIKTHHKYPHLNVAILSKFASLSYFCHFLDFSLITSLIIQFSPLTIFVPYDNELEILRIYKKHHILVVLECLFLKNLHAVGEERILQYVDFTFWYENEDYDNLSCTLFEWFDFKNISESVGGSSQVLPRAPGAIYQ